jgi:DNA modification methylase
MLMQNDGWICRAEIVWQKVNVRPESVKDRPSRDFEKVLMFTKQRSRYFYNPDPIRVPLVTGVISRLKRVGNPDYPGGSKMKFPRINPMGRNAGSVWLIHPSNHYHGHGATMPQELVRRCLLVSCPENGVVLDPFGGAGTTALVALELGHRAISVDINPTYTREARERLEAA